MNRFSDSNSPDRAVTSPMRNLSHEAATSIFRAADTVVIHRKTWRTALSQLRFWSSRKFLLGLIFGLCATITVLLGLIVQLHLH